MTTHVMAPRDAKSTTKPQAKPISIYSIEINGLSYSFGGPLKKGSLNVITDRDPFFVYEREGSFFYAEEDGFVSAYEYVRGSTEGFAGREIKLRVKGGIVFKNKGWHWESFKGSLWDSVNPLNHFGKKYDTTHYHIGQNTLTDHRSCPVCCACYVTQDRMNEILKCLELRETK